MSWIDSVLDKAMELGAWIGGDSVSAGLARAAGLYGIYKLLDNQGLSAAERKEIEDRYTSTGTIGQSTGTLSSTSTALAGQSVSQSSGSGTRLQLNPDPTNRIPVLYGAATFGGHIIDVQLTNNNQDLYYVVALSETTGTLLSTSAASAYTLNDVWFDNNRIIFKSDGITADYMIDTEGNRDDRIEDNVKIYFYAGGRTNPQVPEYYTNLSLDNSEIVMPGWTSVHTMSNLLFAVIKITYNKDKGLTKIPDIQFSITNTMSLPGDCLYDYMTSTRYGAGLTASEIYVS